eukprot:10519730-Heterocapsa_arctica.AAC.1
MGDFVFCPPPLHCEGLVHHRPQCAVDMVSALAHTPRSMKVLSPCVGINAPERAAREMEMPWESVGDYYSQ